MTSSNAGRLPEWSTAEHVPVSELARRQGVNRLADPLRSRLAGHSSASPS